MFASHFGWSKLLKERLWEKLGGNFSVINFEVYPRDEARYMGMSLILIIKFIYLVFLLEMKSPKVLVYLNRAVAKGGRMDVTSPCKKIPLQKQGVFCHLGSLIGKFSNLLAK